MDLYTYSISILLVAVQVQSKVIFEQIDADNSGLLDKSEIMAAMRTIPHIPGSPPVEIVRTPETESRLEAAVDLMIEAVDEDGDGKVRSVHRFSEKNAIRLTAIMCLSGRTCRISKVCQNTWP